MLTTKTRDAASTWLGLISLAVILSTNTAALARSTEIVSISTTGLQGDAVSGRFAGPAISGNGRVIAFDSPASTLVLGDTNRRVDVFVHDRDTGVTERVSISTALVEGDGTSTRPAIDGAGNRIVFDSSSSNLITGDDTNHTTDVFVRDRSLQTTERVSVSSAESEGDGHSHSGTISADGRFVCFVSAASNLVPDDTNFSEDIFVRDLAAGTTERVSVGSVAEQSNSPSTLASISADGRWVAFISSADNLVAGDTNEELDIFLHDRQTGLTERVSTGDAEQEADAASAGPSVSEDGNLVAFWSDATNLVAGDTNGMRDVFVRDRAAGTTERASVSSEGVEADGNSQDPAVRGFLASSPQITADGRYVVFFSSAANLVPDDTNTCGPLFRDRPGHCPDVFVRDRTAGTTTRVNVSADGMQADDRSADPVISASGLAVAFSSAATNLVSFDANACPGFPNCPDIFVHDALPTVVREARYDEGATAAAALSVSVEPNPVAAAFDLRVTGPSSEEMTLIVYDTSGRAVRMLARGRLASTLVRWDGTDIKGNRVEPGTYIAKLSSSEESVTGKITMVEK